MDVTIDGAVLRHALDATSRAATKSHTVLILGHVRLDADGPAGTLTCSATDMEVWASRVVQAATVDASGSIAVPAERLTRLAKAAPEGAQIRLALNATRGQILVDTSRTRATLATLPADDFPAWAGLGDAGAAVTLSGRDLVDACARTAPAISTEETRYYLNGVYVHVTKPSGSGDPILRAVATDGHRLHLTEVAHEHLDAKLPGVIVPRHTQALLRQVLAPDSSATLHLTESRMTIEQDGLTIASKLIDGQFPDYERVMPALTAAGATFARAEFKEALGHVLPLSSDESKAVTLRFDTDRLRVCASDPEHGAAVDGVAAETRDAKGGAIETPGTDVPDVGANGQYLQAALTALAAERVRLRASDSVSPMLLEPADDERDATRVVLMPLRAARFQEV